MPWHSDPPPLARKRVTHTDEASVAAEVDVGPSSAVSRLNDDEVAALRQAGRQWGEAVGQPNARLRDLPVDPRLHRFPRSSESSGASRFTTVDFVAGERSGEVSATSHADAVPSRFGGVVSRLRRVALGAPLASSAVAHERMRKLVALPILSSDALSSVAYGPEAMLAVLALAGSAALDLSLWISAAIVVLMLAVGLSYRQLIKAYPHGGGSYVVAGDNLGRSRAHRRCRAADRLRATVAVSISAGSQRSPPRSPVSTPSAVPLGLGVIGVLLSATCEASARPGRSSPRRPTRSWSRCS